MKNLKVSLKLILGFLLVVALAVLVGVLGIIGMMQINTGSTEMYEMQTAPLADIGEAREYFQRLRVQLREAQMATTYEELDAVEREILIREEGFETYIGAYRPTILTPEYILLYESMMQDYEEYKAAVDDIVAATRLQIEYQMRMDEIMAIAGVLVNSISDDLEYLMTSRIARVVAAGQDDDIRTLVGSMADMSTSVEYLQRLRVQLREAQMATTIEDLEAVEREIANREAGFRTHMEAYGPTIVAAASIERFNDAMSNFDQYVDMVADIVALQREIIANGDLIGEIMVRAGAEATSVADILTDLMDARINIARENADSNASLFTTMLFAVIIVLIIAVAIAMFIALYISRLISKPIGVLKGFMDKAASSGDIDLSAEETEGFNKYSQFKDEIGQAMKSTNQFVTTINNEMDDLAKVGAGDLTVVPEILSDKDKVGNALTRVVDNLNQMFAEINTATNQVAVGSKQIADGAQTLSQGSTEQAASVQQLSSSISEVAQKTKDNAEKANRAATLASSIMQNAEKGSTQMSEMTNAVKDISTSSQNISKVIKVIDDIAFQTNILALNAAVEAARAGQHGKGFAVVAEEVRSLAAKSAEAAKDTGNLIQDSMQKAELGAKIAGDTAESLTEIVSGINESSKLVSEIAVSSEEQSTSISQINMGVDQVAQVTQQNSATAEESAAASQEMSSQSTMLESLIAQFKLKTDSIGSHALPERTQVHTPDQTPEADDNANPVLSNDDSFGKY